MQHPGGPGAAAGTTLLLGHRAPLAVAALYRFLAAHAVPGLHRVEADGSHTRPVPTARGWAVVTVTLGSREDAVVVQVRGDAHGGAQDLATVAAHVRRWLDLDAFPDAIDSALVADPALAALVAARPGLRLPGSVDGAETALLTVLGQQVSLRAAATFAGRLVAAFGAEVGYGLRTFPVPATLVAAGSGDIRAATGVTGARARSLHALAAALADGLVLGPGADPATARDELLALPGIGPWTAEYVALRALGDPDAYPAGDLVLRRALGVGSAAEATARAHRWRPWRGYAAQHLWTRAAYPG